MRHEHYGLHKYPASHREIETSSELVIIQRGRSLQSLIAIDRSELQLDWAQSGAIQALKSMLTFRQKIIRRGGLYKSTRIILSRIIYDIEIRSHKIHSRLKSRAPGSLSKPVWVLAISLSLSSRLPPSLSPSRLAYRVRFAAGQPLPAFQSTRSTSFRHYTISFGLSAISRSLEHRLPRVCSRESEFSGPNYVTRHRAPPSLTLRSRFEVRSFDISAAISATINVGQT